MRRSRLIQRQPRKTFKACPSPISTRLQLLERDEIERTLVRGLQKNRGRDSGVKCFSPAHGAQAPAVIGFQAMKAVLWPWRHQVIATHLRELQKLSRHARADHVRARIVFAGVATTIAKVTGQRIKRTRTQGLAQHVKGRCGQIIRHEERSRGSVGYPFKGTLNAKLYIQSARKRRPYFGAVPWGPNFQNVLPVCQRVIFRPSFKWLGKIGLPLKPFSNAWVGLSQRSFASCGTSCSPALFGCGASA
jgi:hypothetical protein